MEAGEDIEIAKKHKLIIKIAASGLEVCFSLVTFSNSHLLICLCQI